MNRKARIHFEACFNFTFLLLMMCLSPVLPIFILLLFSPPLSIFHLPLSSFLVPFLLLPLYQVCLSSHFLFPYSHLAVGYLPFCSLDISSFLSAMSNGLEIFFFSHIFPSVSPLFREYISFNGLDFTFVSFNDPSFLFSFRFIVLSRLSCFVHHIDTKFHYRVYGKSHPPKSQALKSHPSKSHLVVKCLKR